MYSPGSSDFGGSGARRSSPAAAASTQTASPPAPGPQHPLTPPLPPPNKYDVFEQWLRDNGAQFPQLELCEYDTPETSSEPSNMTLPRHPLDRHPDDIHEEKKEATLRSVPPTGGPSNPSHHSSSGDSELRGVYAKSYLPPNTLCMSIPRRCLITVEMGQATPIGQAILQSDLDLDAPKHIFLMVYLLWDRKVNGPNSFFWPYYQILPPTLRNMPIFWSQDELDELEGSHLLQQIHDRNQAIAEDYYSICQVAPQLAAICTLQEFKWARMCVCSRNFGLVVDGHRTSALVPHADMLNHYRPRQTKWTFDEDRQAFTITTLQPIAAGAQVYDSYGQKCNHRFLLNYGFAVEDNRELDGFCPNEVPLELFVDPEDELFAEKLDFWTRGDLPPGGGGGPRDVGPGGPFAAPGSEAPAAPHHALTVVKRVRVCVSNNENTRLLFSLLRVLACNRAELEALVAPFRTTTTPGRQGFDMGHGNGPLSMMPGGHHSSPTRALFGLPQLSQQLMPPHRTGSTPPHSQSQYSSGNQTFATSSITPISYHRSCRDVRHPLSIENERAAMRLLLDMVQRQLAQYPTTLAQDLQDLAEPPGDPRRPGRYPPYSNRRHAKIQVRGEKQVLHHFAHWAQVALDVLDLLDEELNELRGSVEAQLTPQGGVRTEERPSFEAVVRRMEEQCDNEVLHHTILRYCADVLGSLRREEFKWIRRARVVAGQQQQQPPYDGGLSPQRRSAPGPDANRNGSGFL